MSLLFVSSCAITQINYKSGFEDEKRYKDTRYGMTNGAEIYFSNGVKIGAAYRFRIVDFNFSQNKEEHDFLGDINIPIWKKK